MFGELTRRKAHIAGEAPSAEPVIAGGSAMSGSAHVRELAAKKSALNTTGIPDRLKSGIEAMSGVSLNGAKVHYNSARPAQVNALAMARSPEIHLGPGQEHHLPHEAWHLVQQSKGEVRATGREGQVAIDDSPALEQAADRFGGMAALRTAPARPAHELTPLSIPESPVTQRVVTPGLFGGWYSDRPELTFKQFKTQAEGQLAEAALGPPVPKPVMTGKRGKTEKQTHLVGRASTARGKATMQVGELYDNEFGKDVSRKKQKREDFKDAYREPQIQYVPGQGGAGLDERVSTATTADLRPVIESNFGANKVDEAVGSLSEARDHVNHLMWTKPDDDKQPLNAHPGGLSKVPDDARQGVTHGHTTRDRDRATWTKNEFHQGVTDGNTLPQILTATKLMAGVKTIEQMSQPYSQLQQVDPTKANDAYHPKYGPLIQSQTLQPGFEKAIAESHNNRESSKIQTASGLISEGYGNLVDPAMIALLEQHNNDPDLAHNTRFNEQDASLKDTGPALTQTSLPTTPQSLSQMSTANQTTPGLYRTISAPRLFSKAQYK